MTMKLLYFPRHGDGAIEMAVLCREAGIELEISGRDNGLCGANTTPDDLAGLRPLGVATPDRIDIQQKLYDGCYDAVLIHRAFQVEEYRSTLRSLSRTTPLIIRHSSSEITLLQELGIRNFFSTSQRALDQFPNCNTLLKPKLVDWSRMPPPNHDAASRRGVMSYVNYYWMWPDAFQRFQHLTTVLVPPVVNYGIDSKAGVVADLETMLRSRATVHLKDGGACCFAVIRSLAMGTPVVMDKATWRQGYFDGVEGILVRNSVPEVAKELRLLQTDDDYWSTASRNAYRSAQRQFTANEVIGVSFRRFIASARPDHPVWYSSHRREVFGATDRAATPDVSAVLSEFNMSIFEGLSRVHAAIEQKMMHLFGLSGTRTNTDGSEANG